MHPNGTREKTPTIGLTDERFPLIRIEKLEAVAHNKLYRYTDALLAKKRFSLYERGTRWRFITKKAALGFTFYLIKFQHLFYVFICIIDVRISKVMFTYNTFCLIALLCIQSIKFRPPIGSNVAGCFASTVIWSWFVVFISLYYKNSDIRKIL